VAFVLCTGVDPALLATRKLILEGAGHRVVTATSDEEITQTCRQNRVDVAVIGQTVWREQKKRLFATVRHNCSTVKVLELYTLATGRELKDADDWLEVPTDIPPQLAERVSKLAER